MVKIKLVSLSGEKVTMLQALIRNILLIIPFVLVIGYILEIVLVFLEGTSFSGCLGEDPRSLKFNGLSGIMKF